MGVIQAKRNQSTAEFITSAINLRAFSVKVVAKFPKKYTFYGLHHTYELAQLIVDDLVRANSLYFAKDKTENYNARHDLFDKALLDGQITLAVSDGKSSSSIATN